MAGNEMNKVILMLIATLATTYMYLLLTGDTIFVRIIGAAGLTYTVVIVVIKKLWAIWYD